MDVVTRIGCLVLVAGVACTPDIPGGIYHCGPERSCPPDLACDEVTAVCVYADEARPFACGEGANVTEPDDTLPLASPLGPRGCGFQPVILEGCVDHRDDVDHVAFTTSLDCDARPFGVRLRYSIAFAPIVLELLDDAGEVFATSTVCDELDERGQVHACLEATVPEDASMYLRVRLDGALDCEGRCAYNRYRMSIL